MSVFVKLIFPARPNDLASSIILLLSRIMFGAAFITHGIQKWEAVPTLSATFPDPLGVGSQASLFLAIFAELLCPLALMAGLLTRLALIPMLFTMLMAFFSIHGSDPFAVKELSYLYICIFSILLCTGAGRFSADWMIGRAIDKRKRTYSSYKSTGLDYSR